jgi:hypothetical protein
MGWPWGVHSRPGSTCVRLGYSTVLVWALLLWACHLASCQLEMELATEEPQVLFGEPRKSLQIGQSAACSGVE